MKKIFVLSLAIAGLVLASCNKEITTPATPTDKGRVVTVTATTDDIVTKLSSSSKGKFTWTKGDQIGIWTGSELTAFTLDPASDGYGYGKFSGTLPDGGAITATSYAVYPYDAYTATAASIELKGLNAGWGRNYPTKSYYLYSTAPTTVNDGSVAGFKFAHATAYFRVTLKNIAVSAKAIYYESYSPDRTSSCITYMLNGGSCNLATGAFTYEAADWAFIPLPEHTSVIESYTLIIPVIPEAFGRSKFRICATKEAGFGNEMDGCNFVGWLDVNPKAGDYYVFPDITFPNEKSANDAGSGVNDGIEDAVVNEQDDSFWKVG